MKDLKDLVRPNIWALKPYSSARDEYSGVEASTFLDANENPYNVPYNRYPDPLQGEVKKLLSAVKGVPENSIFLGNGSDEAIDLAFRVFCNPQKDNVVAIEPTYGMYKVCADINDVEYRRVLLDERFQFTASEVMKVVNDHTKLLFLCSPNNPTGNNLVRAEVINVLQAFQGIVVVDEAYSDFSHQKPFREELRRYPNLVVLNTFSKAWGCASIRLGMAFAHPEIIKLFNKVKYPYNISQLTQNKAIELLKRKYDVEKWVSVILEERPRLMDAFSQLPICEKVYQTNANFFLAKMNNAVKVYTYLVGCGIIVRNRTNVTLCDNCLRITVGSPEENSRLLGALRKYNEQ
ncbi:MAG: histidinol-phosphate transaminase [Bacteroidaceae bacterium]